MTEANGLNTELEQDLKPTSVEDLKNIKKRDEEGEVVQLPSFRDGTPFNARLRRPSPLRMAELGQIPDPLSAAVDDLMDPERQRPETTIKERGEVLCIVAEAALVEPAWEDVKDVIDTYQLTAIWEYVAHGVNALLKFRLIRDFYASRSHEHALELQAESDAQGD